MATVTNMAMIPRVAYFVKLRRTAALLIAYATVLATWLGNGPIYGFVLGIDGTVLALALQPVMITVHFSGGTNDTSQVSRHTLAFFGLALFLLVPTLASLVGLFPAGFLAN